ncbi:dehydrogenase [Salmonella enterica]|nr:dehydrogenase [Salmonella enterica]
MIQDANIIGVATGDMGRHRDGSMKEGFQSGMEFWQSILFLPKGPADIWLKS